MSHVTVTDELPSNISAEQDLLGALIAGTAAPADLPGFSAGWFADPIHAAIYRTIEAQIEGGSPTDIGSLGSILGPCSEQHAGLEPGAVLEEVGGAGYLADLADRTPRDITLSARAIRNAWLCRQLVDLGQSITAMAFAGDGTEALQTATQRVAALTVAAQ